MSNQATEGIIVGIRLRPLNEREKSSGQERIFASKNNTVSQTYQGQNVENQSYSYDYAFGENSTTAEVYDRTAKTIVDGVLSGINGCVFAYGQTSSGKTHTMLGSSDQKGVLNMALSDIFSYISTHANRDFIIRASYVEIYNENIRDLLSDRVVSIRVDPRRGVYCEADEIVVSTNEEIVNLLNIGLSRRAVESTAMNDTSSRSHSIFKIVVESRESSRNGYEGDGAVLVASLNLVDLAGSESVRHTNATGKRQVEGGKINMSLLSLSRVIHALSTPGAHVGYRDSKLTHLLQPSLCGNAKMSIICCITTASSYLEETRSTLQFASRAKLIVTHAVVNEVVDDAVLVKRLKKEVELLKSVTSEESVARMSMLEEQFAQLKEQLSVKEATIEQLRAHNETMSMGRMSDASTASIDSFNGSERRASKRQRADGEFEEEGNNDSEENDAAPSLASIKNALSRMHERRAQATSLPAVVVAAVATASGVTPAPAVVAVVAKTEEVKAVPFNPMTLGLRNQLMKELDFKLVARKSKVENTESAPMEEMKEDENVVANRALTAELALLKEELAEAHVIIENQELDMAQAAAVLDETSQRLEAEVQASADLKTASIEAQEALAVKLTASEQLVATLQEQLLQFAQSAAAATNAAEEAVVSELQSENEKLQDEVSSLLGQLEHLQSTSLEENQQLQKEVTELLEQMESSHGDDGVATAELELQLSTKDAQIAAAAEELSAAQVEIKRVQGELETVQVELSALQTTHEATLTSLTEAQTALETREAALAALQVETAETVEKMSTLETDLYAQMEKADTLQTERDSFFEAIAKLETDLAAAREELSALEADRAEHSETIGSTEAERTAALEKIASLEEELQTTQEILESMEADRAADAEKIEKIAALESEHATALEKIESLEAACAAQLESIATLEGARAADLENVAAMETKLSEIIEQGLLAEEHLEAARDQVTELHGTVAAAEDKVEELNEEMSTVLKATAEVEADLAQAHELYAASQEELCVVRAQVVQLEVALQEAVAAAEVAAETAAAAAAQATSVMPVVEEVVSVEELVAVQVALLTAQTEVNSLTEELARVQEAEAAASEQIETLATRVEELTAALEGAEEQNDALVAEKVSQEESLAAMAAEHAASATASTQFASELEASLLQSAQALQVAQVEVSVLTISVEELQSERSELLQQLETLQAELVSAEEQIKAFKPASPKESNNNAGMARMNEFEMSQETLDASRKEMERQVSMVQAELGHKEAEVSRLMGALNEAMERANTAEQRLASADNAFDANESESEGTKKKIAQLQTSVDLLNGEKESLLLKLQTAERQMKSIEGEAAVAVERIERDCAALNKQVEKLSQEAAQSASFRENANEVRRRLEDTIAQRDQHQQRADAAAQRIDTLEAQIEVLQTKADPSGEDASAGEQLAQLRTEKAQLLEDLAEISLRLRKSQEATAQLREQWDQSEPERAALQEQVAQGEIERANLTADLDAALDDINKLTEALEKASNELDELAAQRASTATAGIAMETMEPANDEAIAALESEIEQLKTEQEIVTLEAEVQRDELNQRISELEEDLAAAQEQLEASRAASAILEKEVETLSESKKADASSLQQIHGVCKHQADHVAELMMQLETAQADMVHQRTQAAESMATAQAALKFTISELEGELATMKQKMDFQAESAAQELEIATNSANEELVSLQEQLSTKTEELVALQEQLSAHASANEEMASLQEQLTSQTEEVASLQEQLTVQTEEVASLQEQLSSKTEELAVSMADVERLNSESAAIQQESAALTTRCSAHEVRIGDLESELNELQQAGSESSEAEETLRVALSAAKQELSGVREELRAANELIAGHEDVVAGMKEELAAKEVRIQHLDACKLTKDQMEKIAVIKAEHKKFREDAKMLKKQLHQLSIKYEELKKASVEIRNNGVGGGPATDYVISDLRVQLSTVVSQFEQAQEEVKLLKSKLKECAVQLKEYENDHSGVVAVLERYHIDTRGLVALEHSVLDDETSVLHGDIADAVAQLGEKLDLAKAAVARREVTKSEKVTELEAKLAQVSAEAEEARVQKVSAEKRLEAQKAAAKTARETNGTLTVEIEVLTASVQSLKSELSAAQRSVSSSSEVVSSEVQALEEENIELLKENNELRVQVSRLKSSASTTVVAAAVADAPASTYKSKSTCSSVAGSPTTTGRSGARAGCLSGEKRAFGTDISNLVPNSAVKSTDVTKPVVSAASAVSVTADGSHVEEETGTTRRTRMKVGKAVKATAQVPEEGAECKQS